VDNDSERSAESTVEGTECRWPTRYVHEPTRGISHARNTSVRETNDKTEWLVFIDDDEYAHESWLDELIACQHALGCPVVTGPVIGVLPEDAPAWVHKGNFFQRERFTTGDRRDRAYTNNTLVRREIVLAMDPIFDEHLSLLGGADTYLFRRIHDSGQEIAWCDEAIVYEDVPATRANLGWICRRVFRVGVNTAFHSPRFHGAALGRLRSIAIALVRTTQALLMLTPAVFIGRHAINRQLRWIAYAAGLIAGTLGFRYEEYRATHHGE